MKWIYLLVLVILAGLSYYLGYKHQPKDTSIDDWEYKIDSLQQIIDSIKIDTTPITEIQTKLDTLYLNYEKSVSCILSASDSLQLQFFSEYLSRFPSIDNKTTTETD